ncbi:MAG: lipid II:glycine glycyltransferase FemX [Treponemataceae bacterium]
MFSLDVEKADFQPLEFFNTEHYLQTDFWASFKSMHGWSKFLFKVKILKNKTDFDNEFSDCEFKEFFVTVLVRQFSKFFHIAYVPMGIWLGKPIFLENTQLSNVESKKIQFYFTILKEFSKKIHQFLPKNTIFIRYDPPIEFDTPEKRDEFVKNIFCKEYSNQLYKSNVNIQPPDTTILDLTKTKEELLSNMKNKWRYNIHLAEKKGVKIEKGSADDIDIFYDLYRETSKRDGISIHNKKYYKDLLSLSDEKQKHEDTKGKTPLVCIYFAKHEDDILASIITLFTPYQATYVYGASCNLKRNLMPSYLLQWKAIQDAKQYGCKSYDFYGMPPNDDENHPMHGLYRFKTGFRGNNIHRIGSVDVAVNPLYNLYKLAEKIRNFWFKKIKKKLAGR